MILFTDKEPILFIFDFDRTIADAEKMKHEAQKTILQPYVDGNIRFPNVEQPWLSINRIIYDALYTYLDVEPTVVEQKDALSRREQYIIDQCKQKQISIYDGMDSLLSYINNHYYISMVTGNTRKIGSHLLQSGHIDQYFIESTIVFWDEFDSWSRAKALAKCVDNNILYHDTHFSNVIYVGDAVSDVYAAKDAQQYLSIPIKSIALTHSPYSNIDTLMQAKPDLLLESCKNTIETIDKIISVV